jgi:cell wall-associated NlpC family hydrolase
MPESWTNDFIRIPFKEKGRTRAGADCWGSACIIYAERRNIILPMLDTYQSIKDRVTMSEIIGEESKKWHAIHKDSGLEKEYDIAVFNMAGLPMHVGVVVRPGTMIHCQKGRGMVVEDYRGPDDRMQWSKRLEGFYRYADAACSSEYPAVSSA